MTLWDNLKLNITSNLKNSNKLYTQLPKDLNISNPVPGTLPKNSLIENGAVNFTLDNFDEYFTDTSQSDSLLLNTDTVDATAHYQDFLKQHNMANSDANVEIMDNYYNDQTLNRPFDAYDEEIMNLFGLKAGDTVHLQSSGYPYENDYYLSRGEDTAYLENEELSFLYGRAGDDVLVQDKGRDNEINGEEGQDFLFSYNTRDGVVNAGTDNDLITSENNTDILLLGRDGNDTIYSDNDKYVRIYSGDPFTKGEDNDIINVEKTNDINYTKQSLIVGGHGKTTTINVKDSFAVHIAGNPSQNTFNIDNIQTKYKNVITADNKITGSSTAVDTFNIKNSSGFVATGHILWGENVGIRDKANNVNISSSNSFYYAGGQDVDRMNIKNVETALMYGREGEDLININAANNIVVLGDGEEIYSEDYLTPDKKFNDSIILKNAKESTILGGYGIDTYSIDNVAGVLLDGDDAYGHSSKGDTVNLSKFYRKKGTLDLSKVQRVYTDNIFTNESQEVLSFKSNNGNLLVYPDIESFVLPKDKEWPRAKNTFTYSEIFNALPPAKKSEQEG